MSDDFLKKSHRERYEVRDDVASCYKKAFYFLWSVLIIDSFIPKILQQYQNQSAAGKYSIHNARGQ